MLNFYCLKIALKILDRSEGSKKVNYFSVSIWQAYYAYVIRYMLPFIFQTNLDPLVRFLKS